MYSFRSLYASQYMFIDGFWKKLNYMILNTHSWGLLMLHPEENLYTKKCMFLYLGYASGLMGIMLF